MKKVAFLLSTISIFIACNNTTNQPEEKTESPSEEVVSDFQHYGDTISADNAVQAEQLMAMMNGKDSLLVKVQGRVNESCKMKGCWMKMDLGNGEEMHVTFKDYDFFVPTNLDGETAIMEGYASLDTLDVAYLKHLAQDAGKSEEEIAKITEPEVSLTYVATGVIIKS